MKRKFSLIGRVAIALVLALSLSLMTAVPVAADVSTADVTLSDYATDAIDVVYTIEFDVGVALAEGNTITVTFPSDTTVPSVIDPSYITVEDTNDTASGNPSEVDVVGRAVTMTTASDTGLIEATHTVEVVFLTGAGIVNPSVSGDYHLHVHTNLEETDVPSAAYTITTVPDSFEVVAGIDDTVTAGEAFSVKITALKADETLENGYTGDHLIDFTYEGGPTGTLPTFEVISFNNGVGTSSENFIFTKTSEEDNTITATDNVPASKPSGTTGTITINPGDLDDFVIAEEPGSVEAGVAFITNITVTARDAEGNDKTDYVGTVTWSSSDTSAELPDDYTFTIGDEGVKAFDKADFTLKTVLLDDEGDPIDTTITITDETAEVSKESTDITVAPASAASLTVTADPTSIRADGIHGSTITATALDEFGNTATEYNGADFTVTFSTSLGTMADGDVDPVLGVATDTLTSVVDEVGVATVKVVDTDKETLAYATTTVSLVAALPAEVWVDQVDGNDAYPGTEASPVKTITTGIELAAAGDTINVLPGTYNETLSISIDGLTIQSTGSVAETTIDGTAASIVIQVTADNVTLQGFTIKGIASARENKLVYLDHVEGCVVTDNVIEGPSEGQGVLVFHPTAANTVTNNTISEVYFGIYLKGDEYVLGGSGSTTDANTVSGNTLSAVTLGIDAEFSDGNTIANNTVTGASFAGISLWDADNNTVELNTLANGTGTGAGVRLEAACAGNTIRNNTITGNNSGVGGGGVVFEATVSGLNNVVNYNNIYDNVASDIYDIENKSSVVVDATNNWWGQAGGPEAAQVEGPVIYVPWLDEPYTYTEPVDPVLPVTTIDLVVGWNLISLPLIPEVPAIETMLTDLDVAAVSHYTGGPAGTWSAYFGPDNPANILDEMKDGLGYWMDMNAAGELIFEGWELVAETDPPSVPPSYDVVAGWNLIGFKSTTTSGIAAYLGDVSETLDAIYGYQDGAFIIPTELEPGLGYWIAVTELGTIYP